LETTLTTTFPVSKICPEPIRTERTRRKGERKKKERQKKQERKHKKRLEQRPRRQSKRRQAARLGKLSRSQGRGKKSGRAKRGSRRL
jgi:hypothetical protein